MVQAIIRITTANHSQWKFAGAWHSPPHSLIQHCGTPPNSLLLLPCLIKQAVSVPGPQFQFYSSIFNIHYSANTARGRSPCPPQLFIQQWRWSLWMIPSVSPYCYSKRPTIVLLGVDGPNERPFRGTIFTCESINPLLRHWSETDSKGPVIMVTEKKTM